MFSVAFYFKGFRGRFKYNLELNATIKNNKPQNFLACVCVY